MSTDHIDSNRSKQLFDEFLNIYNRIDTVLRKMLKQDSFTDHASLIRAAEERNYHVQQYSDELRAYARLRNILVHTPVSNAGEIVAIPSRSTVERYRYIYQRLTRPTLALQVAVPGNRLYSARLSDRLCDVIEVMGKNVYTHVPVIDNKGMVGVFSENSLLSYLHQQKELLITKDMTIADVKDYIGFAHHTTEVFLFMRRSTLLKDVHKEFAEAVRKRVRIGAIFITQNGLSSEKILGLITPWDLADTRQLL